MTIQPPVLLSGALIAVLQERGINTLHAGGSVRLPYKTILEPPCSLKWMSAEISLELGAFSYAVSGYFFACRIGRYCSFGEEVQVGRHPHPVDFASTSPIFYQRPGDVLGVGVHPALPDAVTRPSRAPTTLKITTIGNDVYIGHGAFILPGVTIGHGAVVGACAVVTKDVPPYAIVAGSPATVRRYRFEPDMIENLLEAKWWNYMPRDYAGIDPADPKAFVARAHQLRREEQPEYAPTPIHLGELASTMAGKK